MSYILRRYCTGKTAFALKDFFKANGIAMKTSKTYLGYPPVIRWGNSENPTKDDTRFNDPSLIEITANKLKLSKLLTENNIPCITFNRGEPDKYPIVVRRKIMGQGGAGIIVARNSDEWYLYKDCFWSHFIPFKYEIRLHVLGGKPVKILKKTLLDGEIEDEFPIRNNDRKYHYKYRKLDNTYYGNAIQLAEDIFKFFPMMMVGWDMGYVGKGKFYIIEGNSAPSLNSINLNLYGNFLLENLNLCISGKKELNRS